MERHHISSVEFENWLSEFTDEDLKEFSRITLYDLWVEGYSSWEVAGILG